MSVYVYTTMTGYYRIPLYGEDGLQKTLNVIGYENVLQIILAVDKNGEFVYTIIFKKPNGD